MKRHELKTLTGFFESILAGKKNFEVRQNDRDFCKGDILVLKEYDMEKLGTYTGREIIKSVSYILYGGALGIQNGYCVMALQDVTTC